jgi:hypothetical protein
MSICPYVHLSLCPSVPMSICPYVHLSLCPSVPVSIFPCVHLSLCPSVPVSICPCVHHSLRPSVYLSVYVLFPTVYPYVLMSVGLPACLFIHLTVIATTSVFQFVCLISFINCLCPSVCLCTCIRMCLSIWPYINLSVCQCVFICA